MGRVVKWCLLVTPPALAEIKEEVKMSQDSPQKTKPEVLVSTTGVLSLPGTEQGRVRPEVWFALDGTQCFSLKERNDYNEGLRQR